ncbi:hypothetical protein [Wolbachia endosymbiont (group A) of Anoplius nigerrimus]|uniref:hypothetical protein n=1 Tax=Wolbachia endosymbiont (group A) of Anoplius nigerrimus TaxID=2953979 RepID=UPI00222F1F00|nr:hypothetical protein [Wolbachia endosymbiont (group A) of Anoplius nigerrimus]
MASLKFCPQSLGNKNWIPVSGHWDDKNKEATRMTGEGTAVIKEPVSGHCPLVAPNYNVRTVVRGAN